MDVQFSNPTGLDVTAAVTFPTAQAYRVDWGDGSAPQPIASGSPSATHTYAKAGFYKINVIGNDATYDQKVRVGAQALDFPVYDQAELKRRQEDLRDDARAMLATTGRLP